MVAMVEEKSEIHAHVYAACEVIVHLEELMLRAVPGWPTMRYGLRVKAAQSPEQLTKIFVTVWPASWPTGSYIKVELVEATWGWKADNVMLSMEHLRNFSGLALRFRPELSPFPFEIADVDTPEANLLNEFMKNT